MKELFFELKSWIEETEDIDVFIDESYYEISNIKIEDRICNGTAGDDGDITLYLDVKEDPDWELLLSLLIHEFGHVIMFADGRHCHSEKEAWICGIEIVPEKFRHPKLKEHVRMCLKTYGYKRFGWLIRLF